MSTCQTQKTRHFDTVYALLPSALKTAIDDLLSRATRESTVRYTLDQLVRFSLSRDASDHDLDSREEWDTQKQKVEKALSSLHPGAEKGKKRAREEDTPGTSNSDPKTKKVKVDPGSDDSSEDDPVFTLHTISTVSPIRKKVHITVHHNTIRFTHATSGEQEASIPLASLRRAFLIPTPGKSKPHWTVIILTDAEQNQIIFGLDAVPPSLSTTEYPALQNSHPKGTEAKSILTQLLAHLPNRVIIQEPSTTQFRSATGEPFLDAYLRAKDGHLLFFKDGILFGEKKPCMWIGIEEIESVRSLSATGRTFSLFVKRVTDFPEDEMGEEGDGAGEETEFSLIDGKNQDSVARWVQDNQHRFGIRQGQTNATRDGVEVDELAGDEDTPEKKLDDPEDLDDSDFESDSESDGGSATSESSEEEEEEEEEGPEEEEEAHSGDDKDEAEEEELDSLKHPLLRPGAMPKMSKSAINAVVGMVQQDLLGAQHADEDEDDVDQLED